MNILLVTNGYVSRHSGGTQPVRALADYCRTKGHRVLIVAPSADGIADEEGVVRVPSIANIVDANVALPQPAPAYLFEEIDRFGPDIIHTFHPFFLGYTALRLAALWNVPLVYTRNDRPQKYSQMRAEKEDTLQALLLKLTDGYCKMCDAVIVPADGVAASMRSRGVEAPVHVIPPGVDTAALQGGNAQAFRKAHGIPEGAFLAGYIGRLQAEENVGFLLTSVAHCLRSNPGMHAIFIGEGEMKTDIGDVARRLGVEDQVHIGGELNGDDLAGAYAALDAGIFASANPAQNAVIAHVMSAATPVVALDAGTTGDIVEDRVNGRLVEREDIDVFCDALSWISSLPAKARNQLRVHARTTARQHSMERTAQKILALYQSLALTHRRKKATENTWSRLNEEVLQEWGTMGNMATAVIDGMLADNGLEP